MVSEPLASGFLASGSPQQNTWDMTHDDMNHEMARFHSQRKTARDAAATA
jgi:hypothetical protein